ncbi:MAG: ATP-grasp domain-containing protein [Candidatus Acidiferrales bacterium]
MKPKVLLATTCQWYSSARLAMSLAEAGFVVDAVSVSGHPATKTTVLNQIHPYRALAPLASFAEAFETSRPDLLLPCDDLAGEQLQELYDQEHAREEKTTPLAAMIERSMGSATAFPVLRQRAKFMELAKNEGVRVPRTQVISQKSELASWGASAGFPTVLKANGTTGGDGVRVVRSVEEAEAAYRSLHATPLFARALKRALFSGDRTLLRPWIHRLRPDVSAQAFVAGREATTLVACWDGKILGALHFEVLQKRSASGPATVLRWIENDDMKFAAERMVARLQLSGLHGFDFMIESNTENAYLIEINPRATQVGHLALGAGRDLPAALFAAVTGKPIQPAPSVTEKDIIVIFPSEWVRDPNSPYLTQGFHDVPWSQPALLIDTIEKRNKMSSWNARERFSALFSTARASRT